MFSVDDRLTTSGPLHGHRDSSGLVSLGEEILWVDRGFVERTHHCFWRCHSILRVPPAFSRCLQGLADESLLVLTQPSDVSGQLSVLFIICSLNVSPQAGCQ